MKYQVNMFYSLQVEASSEAEAEEKAGEYIQSEEVQGVRLFDMRIEVEEIDEGIVVTYKALNDSEAGARIGDPKCKKCGLTQKAGLREAMRDFVFADVCIRCNKELYQVQ